jgi:hypothetical protein
MTKKTFPFFFPQSKYFLSLPFENSKSTHYEETKKDCISIDAGSGGGVCRRLHETR